MWKNHWETGAESDLQMVGFSDCFVSLQEGTMNSSISPYSARYKPIRV
jgi:hypothetical protein